MALPARAVNLVRSRSQARAAVTAMNSTATMTISGLKQDQAAQHVFHDADAQIERAQVKIPPQAIGVCPPHIHQSREQQG